MKVSNKIKEAIRKNLKKHGYTNKHDIQSYIRGYMKPKGSKSDGQEKDK